MATPEDVLKAQRSLSFALGQKRIGVGLMAVAVIGCVVELSFDPTARMRPISSIGHWLSVLTCAMLTFNGCEERIRRAREIVG